MLIHNTGFDESITGTPSVNGDQIHIPVHFSKQEGGGSFTLIVEQNNESFTITDIVDYQNNSTLP
jgi:hypothetical protein